jgi:hypothetical protein
MESLGIAFVDDAAEPLELESIPWVVAVISVAIDAFLPEEKLVADSQGPAATDTAGVDIHGSREVGCPVDGEPAAAASAVLPSRGELASRSGGPARHRQEKPPSTLVIDPKLLPLCPTLGAPVLP